MHADHASDLEQIHAAIPHRAPMLLVDEIVSIDDATIVCRKTFRESEFFFQGHYPGHPITPGIILTEAGVQSGAILLATKITGDNLIPVLTKLDNVRFKKMIRPGQTIEMHVKLDQQLSKAFYLTAQIKCEGKTAARFSFVCSVTES